MVQSRGMSPRAHTPSQQRLVSSFQRLLTGRQPLVFFCIRTAPEPS